MVLAATAGARAQSASRESPPVAARLTVAPGQDKAAYPCRSAVLTISNNSDRVIRRLAIRWEQGGPTMVYPATVAPKTEQSIPVALPAIWPQQTYDIRALSPEPPPPMVAPLAADISWPVELVTTDEFVDPAACEAWKDDLPTWPAELLRNVFIAAVLTCLAAAGALLAPAGHWRLVALLVVLNAGAFAMVKLTRSAEIVVRKDVPGGLTILTVRRTTYWSTPRKDLAPVYGNQAQLAADTATIHSERGLGLTLRPDEVRIFRKTGERRGGSAATASTDGATIPSR